MKRTVFLLLVLLCLSLTIPSIKAENETCQYWYSDASKVGHWFITPKVASEKLNNNSLFKFSQALSYARNQWTNAGVSTSSGNSIYTANIVVFGGTASEIYEECGIVINPYSSNGRTYYTSVSFFCYVNYQGSQKRVNEFEHIDVYILDNGRSENEYKNTALHELGHALGWQGHSPLSTDVMYESANGVMTLSPRDKKHITQFYTMF